VQRTDRIGTLSETFAPAADLTERGNTEANTTSRGRREVVTGSVADVADSLERTSAELSSISDNVAQYRERVAALAEPFVGTERDDLVIAIHEAERQLRNAERSLQRALRQVG
jgi:hypothetical protein